MPDVGLIDNNASGPDNRPFPEAPVALTGTTQSPDGKATVTFTVSMQPGNNYRGTASLNPLKLGAVTQAQADSNSPPGGVTFTDMLTVWRKLHVELDSMGPVTGNMLNTAFTGISGTGTALTEISGFSSSLDDGSPNLDDTPPGNGRFESGTLVIGSAPSTITISPVTGNGMNRVVFPAASIAGLPFSATDNDLYWNGTMSGTITEVTRSGQAFVWTLHITNHNEDPIDWPDFVGGTLSVGGGSNVDITAVNAAASQLTTSALNIPCTLHDDDDDTLLPKMPDPGAMAAAYEPAYVVPVYDVGDNNMNVPFVLNVTDFVDAQAWDSRSQNANDFWVAYLLQAYQAEPIEDRDPNLEDATLGATANPAGGSMIFLEVHQPHKGIANPSYEERVTVVHETGHAVGNSGDHPVTGNNDRDLDFVADYLVRIRSSARPRP